MATGADKIVDIGSRVRKPVRAPDLRGQVEDDQGDFLDRAELPPDCPVIPLGIQGLKIWVLDASKQLIQMPTDCRKGDMTLIFGGSTWLIDNFPQYGKAAKDEPPPIVGFHQSKVQEKLVTVCQQRGIFNPQGRVFGRGAHRSTENEDVLVLHMGRSVLVAGAPDKKGNPGPLERFRAGRIGESFFPAAQALPSPDENASDPAEARQLMALFGNWYWTEPEVAPLLLLGMSAQMHICGALNWRSHMWLAGPTATGKSTLQKLLRAIHSQWCLSTSDASEAAVRQVLDNDTLPVLIDEAEKDDNPEKQKAILNLAKKASSGDKMYRGSADHKAQEFTAQSCFLFSSVLHGLVKGEERNRVAILNLRPFPEKAVAPEIDLVAWREAGRRMPVKGRLPASSPCAHRASGRSSRWQALSPMKLFTSCRSSGRMSASASPARRRRHISFR